jgi:APA family basic amino acid/polyamine antiporter
VDHPTLPQRLGLFDATTIVAGSMIGSGIFIVSAEAARHVPSPMGLILVWLLTLVITVAGAWSYGRLAAAFPSAGGQYVYLREAFGDLGGFLYGWALLLVIQTGTIAAVCVAFGKYLGALFPAVHAEPWVRLGFLRLSPVELVGVLLIAFLTAWNAISVRRGAVLQNVFTVAKVLSLFGLLGVCLLLGRRLFSPATVWGFEPAALPLAEPLVWAFAVAAVQPLFAADAWNNVTFLSEEVRDPRRNVPLALLLGTCLVCVLYLLTNVGYLNALSATGIASAPQDRVATAAVEALSPGTPAAALMAAVILVSAFGCANGLILSGARVLYAMARDGLFPQALARLSEPARIPVTALAAQGAWAAMLALSGRYGDLLDFVMIAVLAFYVATIAGRFRLARREAALRPGGLLDRLVPAVYVLLVLYVCVGLVYLKPAYPAWALLIVLTGVPAFHLLRRRAPLAAEASGG